MGVYVAKDWFNGAVGRRLQTVDNILPRMALTLFYPDHIDALQHSCYNNVVKHLRELIRNHKITDDHEIAILGMPSLCVHGVIMKNGGIVYDSDDPQKQNTYDPESQTYLYASGCEIKVLKAVRFSDFKTQYIEKIIAPNPVVSPHLG
jgi:hypothetical protein